MRDQLIQYVELLFARARDCEDVKQEILQNTLDRYDDLIAEGKVPEAAFWLAITGIGDLNEILDTQPANPSPGSAQSACHAPAPEADSARRLQRGIGIAMFILCPIPVLLCVVAGQVMLGISLMLAMIAMGTVLMVLSGKGHDSAPRRHATLFGSIAMSLLWPLTTIVYFLISFATGAWFLTWLVFPIAGAISAVIRAIEDWKEETNHEA